jgi:hypothetical protein
MNKRAKKRLKQAIEKDKVERPKMPHETNQFSGKGPQKVKGFLRKPEKKRG